MVQLEETRAKISRIHTYYHILSASLRSRL